MRPDPILLMTRELDLGGTERQLSVVARFLDSQKFRVTVGTFVGRGIRRAELDEAGIPVLEIPVRALYSPKVYPAGRMLREYVRRAGVRLVHSFDYPTSMFAIPALRWGTSVKLLTSQRSYRHLVPQPWRQVVRWTDKNVDAIVVNSAQVHRHMTRDEGVPAERLRLIHNALDLDVFRAPAGPRLRPAEVSGASVIAGCVCVLRPEKDLPTLMRAVKKAAADVPGLRLVIVGSGPSGDGLRRLQAELGLGGICHFIPAASNVAQWYQSMDIFVLPSLTEALSNSLMEAMSCECAAVASSVGGNIEVIEHQKTGLLFDPGNVDQLASHIRALAQDQAERKRLAEAGRMFVADRFASGKIAAEFERVYEEFI